MIVFVRSYSAMMDAFYSVEDVLENVVVPDVVEAKE